MKCSLAKVQRGGLDLPVQLKFTMLLGSTGVKGEKQSAGASAALVG